MKPMTEYLLVEGKLHGTTQARYDTMEEYSQQFGASTSAVSTAVTFRDPIVPHFTILLLVEPDDAPED